MTGRQKAETRTKLAANAVLIGSQADAIALTIREARFVDQYLIHLNGTKAAIEAGFPKAAASVQAYEVLRRPHIREAIARRGMEVARKAEINALRVLEELASIAFAPIVPGMISADAKLKAINMLGNYLGLWLGEGDKPAGAGGNVMNIQIFNIDKGLL